ncbi:uncharacterized protein METZ01_LOCUS93298 [marine metagenome]|uniref:Uncharacterized protein n=1 Tax=marine metagenome TaxID=408172 RepID=A0A381VJS9_9ZZZZ
MHFLDDNSLGVDAVSLLRDINEIQQLKLHDRTDPKNYHTLDKITGNYGVFLIGNQAIIPLYPLVITDKWTFSETQNTKHTPIVSTLEIANLDQHGDYPDKITI